MHLDRISSWWSLGFLKPLLAHCLQVGLIKCIHHTASEKHNFCDHLHLKFEMQILADFKKVPTLEHSTGCLLFQTHSLSTF
jgi:hypothetical protein